MKRFYRQLQLGFWSASIYLCAAAHAQAPVAQSADTQLWTDASVSTALDKEKKTTLTLAAGARVGDDISRVTDRRLSLQILRRVSPNLQLGGMFIYRQLDPTSIRTSHEDRYVLNATFNSSLGKRFDLSSRNLLERRNNEERPDRTLYRNRVQLNYHARIAQTEITPFVATEFFYDFQDKDLFQTRYFVGLNHQFSRSFAADVYYMRLDALGNRVGDLNVIGLNLRFLR